MIEKKVPELRVTMPDNTWKTMVEKAQISDQTQNTGFETEANMKFVLDG